MRSCVAAAPVAMTLSRVNLILFEPAELNRPLPRSDRRAAHIVDVLRRRVGDSFDMGVVNGPRGKAVLAALDADALTLTCALDSTAPTPAAAEPITLIVGLPRPQTARDILRDATTLGVGALHFVRTDKGDPNYGQSTLWSSDEWRRHLIAGAEQAFDTQLPSVTHGASLAATLDALPSAGTRLALDNYEASGPLVDFRVPREDKPVLALGAERGWSAAERERLRAHGFALVHLGRRVLRTETACIAALALLRAKLGLLG
jgi:16S rRNA (uracil1498-N3)-methyltransferase